MHGTAKYIFGGRILSKSPLCLHSVDFFRRGLREAEEGMKVLFKDGGEVRRFMAEEAADAVDNGSKVRRVVQGQAVSVVDLVGPKAGRWNHVRSVRLTEQACHRNSLERVPLFLPSGSQSGPGEGKVGPQGDKLVYEFGRASVGMEKKAARRTAHGHGQ